MAEQEAEHNNNKRLFMARHFKRARSAYKDIRIRSFQHTHTGTHACMHTHYKYMHYWWWVGRMRRKENDRPVCRREEVGFQFWRLSRVQWREWERLEESSRWRVRCIESISPRQGPPAHPRNAEDPSIRGWAKTARSTLLAFKEVNKTKKQTTTTKHHHNNHHQRKQWDRQRRRSI